MKLRVIAVGKTTDREIDEYVKRSRSFMPIERAATRDNASAIEQGRKVGKLVLLDRRGDAMSSEQLAAWLGSLRDDGVREVAFVIGDADGFSERELEHADRVLSLSAMTLPHRIAQLVL